MRLDEIGPAPLGPVQSVIVEREPVQRFAPEYVIPDLYAPWQCSEFLFVHPGVKRCPDDPRPQARPQMLGSMHAAVSPHPGRCQDDFQLRVRGEQLF